MTTLPILKTDSANLPERILVVGDPGRVNIASQLLTDVEPISQSREYSSIRGKFSDTVVGVVSHGVGSAGAGICFEELCKSGAKRIVRMGSAGGMQEDLAAGDIVIVTGAVREDGLSPKLVPTGYPAISTANVLIAMREAAASLGVSTHEGILLSTDMFYPHDILGSDLPLWQKAGVAAVEMEVATLLVVCSLHGVESGAVVAIDGNPMAQDDGSMETYNPDKKSVTWAVQNSLEVALRALVS